MDSQHDRVPPDWISSRLHQVILSSGYFRAGTSRSTPYPRSIQQKARKYYYIHGRTNPIPFPLVFEWIFIKFVGSEFYCWTRMSFDLDLYLTNSDETRVDGVSMMLVNTCDYQLIFFPSTSAPQETVKEWICLWEIVLPSRKYTKPVSDRRKHNSNTSIMVVSDDEERANWARPLWRLNNSIVLLMFLLETSSNLKIEFANLTLVLV